MLDLVEAIRSGLPGSMLTTVHRVLKEAESNESTRETILRFFEYIREGNVDEALEILSSDNPALRHVDIVGDHNLGEGGVLLKSEVFARARDLISEARKSSNVDVWRPILNRTMVLAAQHQGPFSRTWWVDNVAREIGYAEEVSPTFVGLPVLVTKTDRGNGVINGDTGLIVAQDDFAVYQPSTSSTGADAGDKSATKLTPTAIHEWQPWWAMTIHKSQGSEFDNVVVSITPGTRLLSRELLYTAVTRAKSRVTIVGRLEDIRQAIQSPAERFSGLAEILHEAIQVGHNSSSG